MRALKLRSLFLYLLVFFLFIPELKSDQLSYDYVIKDATIINGVDDSTFRADVGIRGEHIVFVGNVENEGSAEVIQATGKVLTPGLIDTHTHSDFNALIYPSLLNKLKQGVTTEVVGNCGMSAAPVYGRQTENIHSVWAREGVSIPDSIEWNSFAQYREHLESHGMLTNYVGLIGHGNLRGSVIGFEAVRASEEQLESMKRLLEKSLEQGARGISFGLVYLPGIFAHTDEVLSLCAVVKKYEGVCAFHMRSEGSALIQAVQEVVDIARETRVRIEISHLKAGGEKNWNKIHQVFEIIEAAREEGLEIYADAYPYIAGFAELGVVLPDEYYQHENRNDLFQDSEKRDAIIVDLKKYFAGNLNRWKTVMVATIPSSKYKTYEGKTLEEIARARGEDPEKVLVELLAATNFEASAFYFSQNQDVVDKVFSRPYVTVGSDSIADGSTFPHPRAFATVPTIFKRYVEDEKTLSLTEAVQKMTSIPAHVFGLENRGQIKVGFFADLVLWDFDKIEARATYQSPSALSDGVEWVFVNGQPALGRETSKVTRAGRFL